MARKLPPRPEISDTLAYNNKLTISADNVNVVYARIQKVLSKRRRPV